MISRREKSKDLRMQNIILVVCEGATEENYVQLLKQHFRSPIKIVTRVGESGVTEKYIRSKIDALKISNNDKVTVCLMYDMDVPAVVERLQNMPHTLLLSNPCVELWFLLHSKNQLKTISTSEVQKELKQSDAVWKLYKKGFLSEPQKALLINKMDEATERAKKLAALSNPSSCVYKLIEIIQENKKGGLPMH